MELTVENLIWWYCCLVAIGLFLLFFRDDKIIILNDIKRGFERNVWIALLHGVLLAILMPLTIPFSLGRILSQWF